MEDLSASKHRETEAQSPEYNNGLQITQPKEAAAGLPALWSSVQYLKDEIGLADGFSLMAKMNQKSGFDCPGCAWPDPDDRRSMIAEYCENGVKAMAEEATKKRIDEAFFKGHSVEELSRQTDMWLGKQGRLTQPMILRENSKHYEPISWEDAFKEIAAELKALQSPDEAMFYTSGRTSNEAAFMYQLFIRRFGTNNLPDCSNMCHESSGTALNETLGIGKGSVTLEDLHKSELILVVGQNPGTNHPRMLSALTECRKNGGTVVSINPLIEAGLKKFIHPQHPSEILKGGSEVCDFFVQVTINGDVPLFKAILMLMLDADEAKGGVFDKNFIEKNTEGYKGLIAHLKQSDFKEAVRQSGVPETDIRKLADLCISKQKIIICWAMGLTQHKNAVNNIRELVNLLLLKGSIGKEGAGTCPVRGHSNVQGDRTMGIWEKPKQAFLDKLKERFGFEPPRQHGYDTVESIHAMLEGKGKVFIAMGGNFLSAAPDTENTAKALRKCSLTVQVSTKLNRSHLITGKKALILPCLGRSEADRQKSGLQFVSCENSMGVVQKSMGDLPPASGHLLSEPAIVAGLAQAVFADPKYAGQASIGWQEMADNYDVARGHIEAVIPGFENYNERIRHEGGFYLPNCARESRFDTDSGKAKFSINPLPGNRLAEGELAMMSIRSHDQFNTTIYGMHDRYRGIFHERRVVLMNPEDIAERGLQERDLVDLVGTEGERRIAKSFFVVSYNIPKNCAATYFPETNVLVPLESVAEGSNTPASKYVKIKVEKSKWAKG